MKSLLILGRQPELGLAELESLYGLDTLNQIGKAGVLLDIDPESVRFAKLGGSVKLAKVLTRFKTTNWNDIQDELDPIIQELTSSLPEGKIKLGLSTYGIRVKTPDINRTGLALKKLIKAQGRSVRIVPNKFPELNSAQVLHNQLTGPTGIELVLARSGEETIVARTIAEQDIEAYAARDQGRPMRDAKVGMLPPKLAQIIINLANPNENERLLDPFCGTGVLLQEALLMGHAAYGTDLEPRMIDYSKQNISWLANKYAVPGKSFSILLEQGDATKHQWQQPVDAVACETYLGKPLSTLPSRQILDQIMRECDEIHENFLRNIGSQLKSGAQLCLAVPAWKTKSGFLHLKTLANLDKLGYTRKKFVHAVNEELIYHRPDQIVARELVVLEKK